MAKIIIAQFSGEDQARMIEIPTEANDVWGKMQKIANGLYDDCHWKMTEYPEIPMITIRTESGTIQIAIRNETRVW